MNGHICHDIIEASKSGHNNCIRILIDQGADINTQDYYNGWTPLHYASKNGHIRQETFMERSV